MNIAEKTQPAIAASNRFADLGDRRLAYRQIGSGKPLLLCNRFRGSMDSWDPEFLDALADQDLAVTWFDYRGLGLSTGEPTYDPAALAADALDLAAALGLEEPGLAGWSIGGIAAQIALATEPDRFTHVVLLGCTPPGRLVKLSDPLFFELAARVNDEDDELALFFEPLSVPSRLAGRESRRRIAQRQDSRSPEVSVGWATSTIAPGPQEVMFASDEVLAAERSTTTPILHIGGDHDIVFPVENWYALNGLLPTLHLLTFPGAGHGPHHQHPRASAQYIATFLRTTSADAARAEADTTPQLKHEREMRR